MVRIPDVHCNDLGSIPGWGSGILQSVRAKKNIHIVDR